jgi:flavin-dependent dehydrogenase
MIQRQIEKTDVLVIGAGPSGTVAAAMTNKAGFKTRIVEKSIFPRFVIGESLIPRVMDHLEEAGFINVLNEQNFQKKFGARFIKNDTICEFDFSERFTDGWTWTWQLPRADFDQLLAKEVEKQGVPVEYQTGVVEIEPRGSSTLVTLEDANGEKRLIDARFLIDASGYARVLPRILGTEQQAKLPPRKAMFVHCKDEKRSIGREGWMISFVVHRQDIWIWVIPFSNGTTSLGVVGNPEFFKDFKGSNEEILRAIIDQDPNYRDRFRNTEFLWEPKVMEAYAASTSEMYGPGYAIVGNSVEFLDPVFSSGVMFATESGILAGKLAARQLSGETIDWQKEYTDYIQNAVMTFRTYVKSWYDGALQDVFFADNPSPEVKKQLSSILAGYVWDKKNPFVRNHQTTVYNLANLISGYEKYSRDEIMT